MHCCSHVLDFPSLFFHVFMLSLCVSSLYGYSLYVSDLQISSLPLCSNLFACSGLLIVSICSCFSTCLHVPVSLCVPVQSIPIISYHIASWHFFSFFLGVHVNSNFIFRFLYYYLSSPIFYIFMFSVFFMFSCLSTIMSSFFLFIDWLIIFAFL